jgi:NADP-reducing hydrogenase subunit HndB
MPKLTIEDLKKMRDDMQRQRRQRDDQARATVNIHMGTCGISAGARQILTALMEALEKKGISDVIVMTSGCAGLCAREPMATVTVAGTSPVKYVELTPAKALRILDEHVVGGKVVAEFALGMGSEKIA